MKIAVIVLIIVLIKFLLNIQHVIFLERMKNKIYKGGTVSKYEIRLKRVLYKANIPKDTILYTNFNSFGKDVINAIEKAAQEYLHRALQAFNPLFWIELIIFLPRYIIRYFGGQENSIFSKIIIFIYWLATGYTTFFRPEVREYILSYFK